MLSEGEMRHQFALEVWAHLASQRCRRHEIGVGWRLGKARGATIIACLACGQSFSLDCEQYGWLVGWSGQSGLEVTIQDSGSQVEAGSGASQSVRTSLASDLVRSRLVTPGICPPES